jgi:hypothetical protein
MSPRYEGKPTHASWLLTGDSDLKSVMHRTGHAQITTAEKPPHPRLRQPHNLTSLHSTAAGPDRRRHGPQPPSPGGIVGHSHGSGRTRAPDNARSPAPSPQAPPVPAHGYPQRSSQRRPSPNPRRTRRPGPRKHSRHRPRTPAPAHPPRAPPTGKSGPDVAASVRVSSADVQQVIGFGDQRLCAESGQDFAGLQYQRTRG